MRTIGKTIRISVRRVAYGDIGRRRVYHRVQVLEYEAAAINVRLRLEILLQWKLRLRNRSQNLR
jgi:hypothetical protein